MRFSFDPFLLSLAKFFGAECALCGQQALGRLSLCRSCLVRLPWLKARCQRCALPLPDYKPFCGRCLKHKYFFDRVHALFYFEWPVDEFVTKLKYKEKLIYAQMLGLLMAKRYAKVSLPECLIPVPCFSAKQRARGFNQAAELSRPIAHYLKIPLKLHIAKKVRDTKSQSQLSALARTKNNVLAFEVADNFPFSHVAIVDDVMTTGATVNNLAKALKAKGAQRVDVWCCCRTAL